MHHKSLYCESGLQLDKNIYNLMILKDTSVKGLNYHSYIFSLHTFHWNAVSITLSLGSLSLPSLLFLQLLLQNNCNIFFIHKDHLSKIFYVYSFQFSHAHFVFCVCFCIFIHSIWDCLNFLCFIPKIFITISLSFLSCMKCKIRE